MNNALVRFLGVQLLNELVCPSVRHSLSYSLNQSLSKSVTDGGQTQRGKECFQPVNNAMVRFLGVQLLNELVCPSVSHSLSYSPSQSLSK